MTDPHTWWFLEDANGRWLENIDHGTFTDNPNQALKWPNGMAADHIRRGLRSPLWTLKATEHMWVEPTLPPPEDARTIDEIWQEILEMDDRTSEHPDMVLLTYEEFKGYLNEYRRVSAPPEDERVKGLIDALKYCGSYKNCDHESQRRANAALAAYRGGA